MGANHKNLLGYFKHGSKDKIADVFCFVLFCSMETTEKYRPALFTLIFINVHLVEYLHYR